MITFTATTAAQAVANARAAGISETARPTRFVRVAGVWRLCF